MKTLLSRPYLRRIGLACLMAGSFIAGRQTKPQSVVAPVANATVATRVDKPITHAIQSAVDGPKADTSRQRAASQPPSQPQTPISRLAQYLETVSKWNDRQTLGALRQLDLEPASVETKLRRHILVSRFAELDPRTAMTYVETLSGAEHDDQATNVLSTWASNDPNAAASHLQSTALNGGLASSEDRAMAASVASEWAKKDPAAALKWCATLPEEVRGEARGRILVGMAAGNPTLAAQYASTLPAGYERAEAMQPLASQWAQSSPLQAASWVQSLSDPNEQAQAAGGLVSAWMNSDPLSASQWVSALKPGPVRDAAVTELVKSPSIRNDPEAATLWASSVQDESLRQTLLGTTTAAWRRQDSQSALSWQMINGQ